MAKKIKGPYLSIGIIFRDDIRCIERCLKSLDPLRKAIPCQLVMADTGSVDGSRAIAEQYADVLFDFPWVDDFSAARNAVMDRCVGQWYIAVDTDEWLDADFRELTAFLRGDNRKAGETCTVIQRNYMSSEDETDVRDFMAMRMVRMASGLRYQGAVHELLCHSDDPKRPLRVTPLSRTVLHHDGYKNQSSDEISAKKKRNMELLLRELEKHPEDIRILLQCIESTGASEESMEYIHRGIAAVEAKGDRWELFGPPIFRYAVVRANTQELEEAERWAARAKELFPKSFYTRIDIYLQMFIHNWEKENMGECVRLGEAYLTAMADYRAGRGDQDAMVSSTLIFATDKWERALRSVLAHAYFQIGEPKRAVKMLDTLDFSLVDAEQTQNSMLLLRDLHKGTEIDTAPLVLRLYEGICQPTPSEERAEERKKIFSDVAASLFSSIEEEEKLVYFARRSCTMLAPLAGQCEWGDAAAIFMAKSASEKERLLLAADKPYAMPQEVLRRAILSGIDFPLREKPLNMEEMDSLANTLARKDGMKILKQAVDAMDAGFQQLVWAKSAAWAAISTWKWEDSEQSMDLARTFVRVEEAFLPRCYTPELLCEENILLLPSIHRFGWYCGRAFQALDAGDSTGYVRLLRAGLESSPGMKDMVKFLTGYVPELRTPAPSAELLALAEKVRAMLSMFSPDDPAVAELKASPIYQEVAHLIEGIEAPVLGGLAQ